MLNTVKKFPALAVFVTLFIVFLLAPLVAVISSSVTTTRFPVFPPQGFTFQWYQKAINYRPYVQGFSTSFILALLTALASTVIGTLGALSLMRFRFPGRDLLNTMALSPLILPTVFIGISLLQLYTMLGFRASIWTLLVGHIIITFPYVIRMVSASLVGLDRNIELAARGLGASAWVTFYRVTLPLIKTGIFAGLVFAFIMSFDNVTVSIFLSTPKVGTLPVRIYAEVEHMMETHILAVGTWMIIFAVIVIVVLERVVGLGRVFGVEEEARR